MEIRTMHLTKYQRGIDKMTKELDMLGRIDEAITNIKRGKQKLTISRIAEKAKTARKTIYNRPELKLRCDQAIQIQEQQNLSVKEIAAKQKLNGGSPPLSGNKLLEERYRKARDNLKLQHEKNAKLLENNRKLVIEKDQLKGRIVYLEERIQKMKDNIVRPMK